MKVIIGVDGSADSLEAARQVGYLFGASDSAVLYYSPPAIAIPSGHATSPEVVEKARHALAQAVFDEARAALPENLRGSVQTVLGTQDPRHGLLAAADQAKAEMIVVGARGTSPVMRLLIGNITRAIVHSSKLPVLVARRPASSRPAGGLRVLLAYDGSPANEEASELFNRLSFAGDTTVHIVTVIERQFPGEIPDWLERDALDPEVKSWAEAWEREHEAERQAKLAVLKSICAKSSSGARKTECEVREGYPADEILKVVAEQSIDLVVLGARKLGALSRFLLGSTSETMLSHAPCSVLIVRERDKP